MGPGARPRIRTPKLGVFSFFVGSGVQDSFCAAPARIQVAPLDCDAEDYLRGCKRVKGCQEFSVLDDAGDSFHFYWDSTRRQLAWWLR